LTNLVVEIVENDVLSLFFYKLVVGLLSDGLIDKRTVFNVFDRLDFEFDGSQFFGEGITLKLFR
jgi:hypothetical protein